MMPDTPPGPGIRMTAPARSPGRGPWRLRPGRAAFPGAPPAAPSFEDEVRAAVSYEKGLAGKAMVAIAIVAIVIAVRFLFLG
jgi:hypothetical protein